MVAMNGGRGPAMTGGPAYIRDGAAPYREPGSRKPEDAFALLLTSGANPNAKGPDGSTLLHQAARTGNLEMIRVLASAKVDFDQKNNDGFTALDVAEGKQPAGGAGARGGGPPGGRGRGRGANQQEVAKLLRELMGLPPAPAAAPAPDLPPRSCSEEGALRGGDAVRRRDGVTDDAGAGSRQPEVGSQSGRSLAKPEAKADTPLAYQAMVTRYCVGCHNTRNPLPAGAPLALDTANLADPGADAATWERVVKKLGVGAMPPQGAPTPGHAELTKFRSALVASLDTAAARKQSPGRYVLHRLNRTEYANAVRDLLGVTVDVADLLPSDGGDFGFDNIATALTTSPLLLERYLTAGLADRRTGRRRRRRRAWHGDLHDQHGGHAEPARGRAAARARAAALLVRHPFPADGEYVFSGRLLKTVAEGLAGVEGHETPHLFIVTIDGKQVFSAPIGGKDDHDRATENKPVAREEFDKRMMSPRIKVTAGLHEVGFTFVERPMQEQNMWLPTLRATQEAHNPSGMPRLRNAIIEGPYGVSGLSDTASRQRLFVCTPRSAAQEPACADQILSTVARRAFRRPVTKADVEAPLALYREERSAGGDFNAGIRVGLARILTSPAFLFRSEERPGGPSRGCGASCHRARACQPAVVLPVEQHPGRRAAEPGRSRAGCARRVCFRRRCGA